jgi:hypothetical protein
MITAVNGITQTMGCCRTQYMRGAGLFLIEPREGTMVNFNIGDRVERIGLRAKQQGIVIRIIPNEDGKDWLHQYEVEFAESSSTFYASQLVLGKRISRRRAENNRA